MVSVKTYCFRFNALSFLLLLRQLEGFNLCHLGKFTWHERYEINKTYALIHSFTSAHIHAHQGCLLLGLLGLLGLLRLLGLLGLLRSLGLLGLLELQGLLELLLGLLELQGLLELLLGLLGLPLLPLHNDRIALSYKHN